MRIISFTIPPEYNGKKIRDFLGDFGVSSALLTKLKLNPKGILLNGKAIRTIDCINSGDILKIQINKSGNSPTPGNQKADIVFEDEDIVIANKPPFMPVHESRNHQGDALSNAIAAACDDFGAFRSVYRLDRDTSGLVLVAKNELAAAKLAGKIQKDYYAIVNGDFSGCGTIDSPIMRQENSIIKRIVHPNGSCAVTHWQSVSTKNANTLLKINLETGRTHQIRVHFSSIGAPLLGDTLYGGASSLINRQALHCKTIRFVHPITQKEMEITCDFPKDFKGLM